LSGKIEKERNINGWREEYSSLKRRQNHPPGKTFKKKIVEMYMALLEQVERHSSARMKIY
jgi:hypothetical protein